MENHQRANDVAVAVLQNDMDHVKTGMAELKITNAAQSVKLDHLVRAVDEARGGWKTLLILGGVSSSIGGAVSWIATHWRG
jgi:hypothetical protein